MTSLTIKTLIANPRLKFLLTHRKLSPLKIPNRKYIAIFQARRGSACVASTLVTDHSPLITALLIDVPAIKNPSNALTKSRLAISNRQSKEGLRIQSTQREIRLSIQRRVGEISVKVTRVSGSSDHRSVVSRKRPAGEVNIN